MPPLILRSNYYCVAISQIPFTCTSSSSSNFWGIFVAAMKAYEKKTKTSLLTHPLAAQPQSCESFSDNFAVLHDKVNEFEKFRSQQDIIKLAQPNNQCPLCILCSSGTKGWTMSLKYQFLPNYYIISTLNGLRDILAHKYNLCWCSRPLLGEYPPIPCGYMIIAIFFQAVDTSR